VSLIFPWVPHSLPLKLTWHPLPLLVYPHPRPPIVDLRLTLLRYITVLITNERQVFGPFLVNFFEVQNPTRSLVLNVIMPKLLVILLLCS